MQFHGTSKGLKVVDGRQEDWLITARFMQSESQAKFGSYMQKLATELGSMEAFSVAMSEKLQAAEDTVQAAQLAESFLEEVTFG